MKTIRLYAISILMTIAAGASHVCAHDTDHQADLDELLQQLDEAIDHSPEYVAERERQISQTRHLYLTETAPEKKFSLSEQLFRLYKPYKNDSALSYAQRCIDLAESLQRRDLAGRYRSVLAYQYSNADMYVEAVTLLRQVDKGDLDSLGLTDYYGAWMHVCGQIGSYTESKEVQGKYFALQDQYRDSVLMVADKQSEAYLHLKVDVLSARSLYQEALSVNDSWLSMVSDGTHENAFAAFYRSMVYDRLGNDRQLHYWLGKSALDDIKCAVMDQASILMLAEHLCQDGDFHRAFRYISFGKECNQRFSPQLRRYQVGIVLNALESCRQNQLNSSGHITAFAVVATALLLACICCFLRRKKRP